MVTELKDEIVGNDHYQEDGLSHWFCSCTPSKALCGADVSSDEKAGDGDPDPDCIVCEDLLYRECPRCESQRRPQ